MLIQERNFLGLKGGVWVVMKLFINLIVNCMIKFKIWQNFSIIWVKICENGLKMINL